MWLFRQKIPILGSGCHIFGSLLQGAEVPEIAKIKKLLICFERIEREKKTMALFDWLYF